MSLWKPLDLWMFRAIRISPCQYEVEWTAQHLTEQSSSCCKEVWLHIPVYSQANPLWVEICHCFFTKLDLLSDPFEGQGPHCLYAPKPVLAQPQLTPTCCTGVPLQIRMIWQVPSEITQQKNNVWLCWPCSLSTQKFHCWKTISASARTFLNLTPGWWNHNLTAFHTVRNLFKRPPCNRENCPSCTAQLVELRGQISIASIQTCPHEADWSLRIPWPVSDAGLRLGWLWDVWEGMHHAAPSQAKGNAHCQSSRDAEQASKHDIQSHSETFPLNCRAEAGRI